MVVADRPFDRGARFALEPSCGFEAALQLIATGPRCDALATVAAVAEKYNRACSAAQPLFMYVQRLNR